MNNISANGTLDTDKMVRALLMLRNTPDPTCKLSPTEVVFGWRLRDSLSGISKKISTYDKPHIVHFWKEARNLKEQSLKERYVDDNVFMQNQTGNNPIRWEHNGVAVETKDFDQYLVILFHFILFILSLKLTNLQNLHIQ